MAAAGGNSNLVTSVEDFKTKFAVHAEFSSQPVGDEGAEIIAEKIKIDMVIKKITMVSCGVTPIGVALIAKSLMINCNLSVLDLSGNIVGWMGSKALGVMLISNIKLQVLILNDTHMDDDCVANVAYGLEDNTTLHCLKLNGNQITLKGINSLLEGKALSHIIELDISGNRLPASIMQNVAAVIERTKTESHTYVDYTSTGFQLGGPAYEKERVVCCHLMQASMDRVMTEENYNCYPNLHSLTIHGPNYFSNYVPKYLHRVTSLKKVVLLGCKFGENDPIQRRPRNHNDDGDDDDNNNNNNNNNNNGNSDSSSGKRKRNGNGDGGNAHKLPRVECN